MSTASEADTPRAPVWSSHLVEAFGALMVLNWLVAMLSGGVGATGGDLVFTAALLATSIWCGSLLRARRRSGWVVAVAIGVGGLFFVAPVMGTILLGGGASPVGTGWDVIFFPLVTILLVALLISLRVASPDFDEVSDAPG